MQYLVGTPKGRLTMLERASLEKPWVKAREDVRVKLLAQDRELYVFAKLTRPAFRGQAAIVQQLAPTHQQAAVRRL